MRKYRSKAFFYLRMMECEGLSICFVDDFSRLGSFKRVYIERCEGIECTLRSDHQDLLLPQISTLEEIKLEGLDDMKGVMIKKEEIGASVAPAKIVFSSLISLDIRYCIKIGNLGLPVLSFPNLECIEIEGCGEVQEIFEDDGRGSVTLPKLKRLILHELPGLERVCKAALICNSIETIEIVQCPRMMKKLLLHLDVCPPPTLTEIYVNEEWWESLEWDNPNLPQLLRPFLRFYEKPQFSYWPPSPPPLACKKGVVFDEDI